jgi:hypothetical protein
MKGDEDNEQELEFLESLTLKDLENLADNVHESVREL